MKRLILAVVGVMVGTASASADICNLLGHRGQALEECRMGAAMLELLQAGVLDSPAPQEDGTKLARERAWTDRCKPVKRRDANGIDRYEYAHPDCGGSVLIGGK